MSELIRLNKEIKDKLKEILSKIKLDDKLEELTIEILFLIKLKFVLNQYYKTEFGLRYLKVEDLVSYFYDYDLEMFNFLDEYQIMDFINDRLMEHECEVENG